MGVSGRTTYAIEPKNSDLLIPDHRAGRGPARSRDIEDASFEILGSARDTAFTAHAQPHTRPHSRQVFKSRLTQSEPGGPFPRDFASPDPAPIIMRPEPGERLGVFGSGPSRASSAAAGLPSAGAAFALTVCAIAAAAFWMAGGHSLVIAPSGQLQASGQTPGSIAPVHGQAETGQSVTSVAAAPSDDALMTPDPIVTASTPADTPLAASSSSASSGSFVDLKPRPARIERAGSILMIRPQSE